MIYIINKHGHYFSSTDELLSTSKLVESGCTVLNDEKTFKRTLLNSDIDIGVEEEDILTTTFVLDEYRDEFGDWDDRGFFNSMQSELERFDSKESAVAQYEI